MKLNDIPALFVRLSFGTGSRQVSGSLQERESRHYPEPWSPGWVNVHPKFLVVDWLCAVAALNVLKANAVNPSVQQALQSSIPHSCLPSARSSLLWQETRKYVCRWSGKTFRLFIPLFPRFTHLSS